jgi:hypothetical protein
MVSNPVGGTHANPLLLGDVELVHGSSMISLVHEVSAPQDTQSPMKMSSGRKADTSMLGTSTT